MAGIATLGEMKEHWTILDICDANEALDIKIEHEEYEAKKAKHNR